MRKNMLQKFFIGTVLFLFTTLGVHASFFDSVTDYVSSGQDTVLYNAYKSYMYWVDTGVQGRSARLPARLTELMKSSYNYNVAEAKFSYTTRFDNLAMTDCKQIYLSDRALLNKLRDGQKLTSAELYLIAHELTHTEQCVRIGGRKKYALRWFGEVGDTVIRQIARGRFTNILGDIRSAQRLARYDNGMAMEVHADTRAASVVRSVFSNQ